MDIESEHIGRRVREIRAWRGLNLGAVAGLSGMSSAYLSRIERGERPVTKRATLEALAHALRVSPTELTGQPWTPVDPVGANARTALVAVETALESYELGTDPDVPVRPWPEIEADVVRLVDLMHVHADYVAQGELAPRLMAELHAVYVRDPQHRRDALRGLIRCYSSATWVTKRLGGRGLPALASRMAQECADELEAPEWLGYTTWLRGDATGQLNRAQQYTRSVRMAEQLSASLDDPNVVQSYGMLHLSAALAAAAQDDRDTAATHIGEATAVAGRLDSEVGTFARMWFGTVNVGIWSVSLATEFGDGPKVAEIARDVHVDLIPSPSRKAEFLCDVGRSLMDEPATRNKGLATLLQAEELAPQRVHNDVFVREAVADQLRRARRDAGGRDLRGLAWRLGVAPTA